MAETSAEPIKPAQTSAPAAPAEPQEPPKRGRGRPPLSREGIPTHQEPLPAKGADDDPFFSWLGGFTPQEWQDALFLYLYRCEPITDRKQTGNHNYIIKYTKPVDPQQIMEEYGSGKYLLVLNRFNPQTRKYLVVENHYFKVLNPNFPPKIPYGEWVDDERNSEWQWAKPQLQAERDKQKGGAVTQQAGFTDGVAMFNAVMAGVEKLRPNQSPEEQKTLAHLVIETLEKNSDKMLALATNQTGAMEIVDKVLAVIKPGDGGDMLKFFMAQLLEEQKFSREILIKMNTPATAEPKKSFKEELLEMKDVMGMLRGGGSAASSGTDWGGVALQLGGKLLEVGGAIAQVAMARAGQKPPQRPAQTVTVPATLPQPIAQEAPQPIQQTPEQQMFQELEMLNATLGGMFDMVTPHLVDMFHKATGMHFRDWFLDEFGDFSYREIKRLGPEKVLALFELRKQVAAANIQQLLSQLQPPEKVQTFVLQFLSDEPADEDDGEDDPEKPGSPGESRSKDF